jgi:hypothetical protein
LAAALLAVFIISRLPYFWFYPSVRMAQDTNGYLDLVKEVQDGHLPHFIFRTPGYPLFFWLITLFTWRWIAVVYVQNLLSLASSLVLVHAVSRLRRSLAVPATLAMCGFLGSSQVVLYDVALLSECLYTNCVILTVAFLLHAFRDASRANLGTASALMAFAILVRPAGVYFGVTYALVLAFLAWNRLPARSVVAFLVPFPAILLVFCAYNYATISSFAITMGGETNLAGATALFWEPDPRLPAEVNRALKDLPASYAREGITPADLAVLRTSWDSDQLFPVFAKAYNRLAWSEGWGDGKRFGARDYVSARAYIKQVSLLAIRRHPILYAKFVWVNVVEYFRGVGYKFDVRSALSYREQGNPGDARWRASPAPLEPDHAAAPAGNPGASGLERLVTALQLGWQSVQGALFQRTLWSWALFCMLALSAVKLARSRGRDVGSFLLLALTLIPVGSSLVVCLVEVAADRYSYPTQFIYYLCVALAPLLWGPALASPGVGRAGAG